MNSKGLKDLTRSSKMKKYFILVSMFVGMICNTGLATHIVGGELTYVCLGNNKFEVTLVVRRDCEFGADDAPFDDPAAIAVFDEAGNQLRYLGLGGEFLLPFMGDDTVSNDMTACFHQGVSVCVHEAVYMAVIDLPTNVANFTLAYQRCCRNETLNNIINPIETGATYFVTITQDAQESCNNSPLFSDWADIYICAGRELVFDHSAVDADGDSLVYKICTPTTGASIEDPLPRPASNPPYDLVTHTSGFNNDNLMGGVPLEIDAETGLLTATPELVGQYLVGVCVEEYRDGVLLSTVRRDFEFNVRPCIERPEIDFSISQEECTTANEVNISLVTNDNDLADGASGEDNQWLIVNGDDTITGEGNPFLFSAPINDSLTISLTSSFGNGCNISTTKGYNTLSLKGDTPRFGFTIANCGDDEINATFTSEFDTLGGLAVTNVEWVFFMGNNSFAMEGKSVDVQIPNRFNLMTRLKLTLENGCSVSITEEVDFGDIPSLQIFSNPLYICDGMTPKLVGNPNASWVYFWTPETGLEFEDGDKSNPTFVGTTSQNYEVFISTPLCTVTENIAVVVLDDINIEVGGDLENCSSIGTMYIENPLPLTYEWATDADFNISIGQGDTIQYNLEGMPGATFYVKAIAPNGCESAVNSVDVSTSNDISIEFTDGGDGTVEVCAGVGGMIILNPNPNYTYTWSPMEGISGDLSNPKVNPTETTVYTVTVVNGLCEASAEIEVVPGDRLEIAVKGTDEDGNVNTCASSVSLEVVGNCEPNYEWSRMEDFSNVLSTSPNYNINRSGIYYVRAVINDECDSEVETIIVSLGEGPGLEFTDGGDGIVEVCEGIGGMIILNPNPAWTYTWSPMEGISGELSNPKVNPTETTTYTITVTDGTCETTGTIVVMPGDRLEIGIVGLDDDGGITSCAGSTMLNATGNCDDRYEWSITEDFNQILGANSFLNVTDSGTYYVRAVLDGNCSSEVEAVEVTLGNGPSIEFTDGGDGEVNVCQGTGGQIVLNPNPDWTYTWSPMDGISGDLSNPKVNPNETTVYTVTVSDGTCETVAQIRVVPGDALDIGIKGADSDGNVISCGGSTLLEVVGSCEPNYEWSRTSNFDEVISNQAFLNVTSAGTYYVRAILGDDCQSEVEEINVTLGDGPSISFTDGGDGTVEICEGVGGMIVMNPNPDWTYTWIPTDGISGDLSNPKVNPSSATEYTVTVSDGECSTTGKVEVVPGANLDLEIVEEDENGMVVNCSESQVLTVRGNCEPNYEWSTDPNFTDVIGTSESITVTESGDYYVRATINSSCQSEVEEIQVLLSNADLSIEFTGNDGVAEVCLGIGAQIVANPNIDLVYTWTPMDGISGDLSNPTVNPTETTTYTVTASDGNCEVTEQIEVRPTDMMEITIVEADEDGNVNSCSPTASLTAIGNVEDTYEWSLDDSFEEILSTESSITVDASGVYFARAIMSTECTSNIAEITVTLSQGEVSVSFIDEENGMVEVCEGVGGMIIANSNPDWTYTWSPMDGISGELHNPKVNPSETTTYTVTVSDGFCEATEEIEVVLGDELKINLSGLDTDGNLDVCGAASVVNVSGNCEPNYEWAMDAEFSEIISTEDFLNVTAPGDYFVRAVTGEASCTSEVEQFTAILGDGPSIEFTDGGDGVVDVCEGIGAMIVANPNPEWTYTWTPMDGISGDLSNPKVNPIETTEYEVTVSDGSCETSSKITVVPGNSMEITVSGLDADGNVDVCSGSVMVTAMGNCTPDYEWSRATDFATILSTKDFYNVTEEGIYYVRAITGSETCESNVIMFEAILGDGPSIEFTDGGDGTVEVCQGVGGMIIANPNPEWTYTWSPMEGITGDLSNPKVNPTETTMYTVTVTDGVCETVAMVEVVPGNTLEIAVEGADSEGRVLVCNGETVIIKATGNCEPNYEWSINESFDPIISTSDELSTQVSLGDTYYVRAVVESCESEVEKIVLSDISGEFELPEGAMICPGDTLTFTLEQINGADDITISWEENENIISRLDTAEISVVQLEGDSSIVLNYTKTSADGACLSMGSVTIPSGSPIDEGELMFTRECGTFTVCFTSGMENGAGSWDFGVDSIETDISMEGSPCFTYPGPGEYIVNVKVDSVACGASEMSLSVLLTDMMDVSTPIDTVFFCEGDDMLVSANSTTPENIVWIAENGDTLGSGPTITVGPASDTTIYAIVDDGLGCIDSAAVFLDGYFFDVTVMNPDVVCPGEMIVVSAMNNSSDSLTYAWGPEEIILSGADSQIAVISVQENAEVFLTVTNIENGCTKEFTIPITLGSLDVVLDADPDVNINRGESVEITATTEGDSLSYAWSNGETTEIINVSPDETTTYNVQVTDESGCTANGMITIEVRQAICDETDVFLPDAFSPNGDGANDELMVRSNFIKEMTFDVYDRWGEAVFNTQDQRVGWNGTFRNTGEELTPDVYAYCLKATCTNDVEYVKLGNITLVR